MTTLEEKRPLSVSQYNSYSRCAYSWWLARVLKAWQRPAAWLPQGSAVHTVAEHIERNKLSGSPLDLEQAQDLFRSEYSKEVGKYTEITPNFEYWFASGPYRGEVDVERRYEIGLEQVQKMMAWTDSHTGEVIWIAPDGKPGIELDFDIELDGIRVRGFIDAVLQNGCSGEAYVRDYKTGNTPGDDFQLAVYGVALAEMYGVGVGSGDYFMAGKKGKPAKPTYPYDLTEWTRERVAAKFQELEENIQNERFDPKPDPNVCNFCDVALSCQYRAC